jgi:hypothetical protein
LGELVSGIGMGDGDAPAVIVIGGVAALDVRAEPAEIPAYRVADSKMASRR